MGGKGLGGFGGVSYMRGVSLEELFALEGSGGGGGGRWSQPLTTVDNRWSQRQETSEGLDSNGFNCFEPPISI